MYNISNKQKITLTIDTDVYLKIKTSGLNMSGLVNDYLNLFFEEDSPIKASDQLEEDMKRKQEELTRIQIDLLRAKEREQKLYSEKISEAKSWNEAKKNSRVLDYD